MPAEYLTENEKLVLYHLVAYPLGSDKEISTRVSLGVSTVTKIRNKLIQEGYIRAVNIPSAQMIGAEIISLGYGEFDPDIPLDHKLEVGQKFLDRSSGTFFTMGDGNQAIGMGFHRRYTDAMNTHLLTSKVLSREASLTTGQIVPVISSLEIARFFRFFNYAPLLAKEFGIEDKDYSEPDRYFSPSPEVKFTKKERTVLYGLVKYPSFTDKKLSSCLGISRQTISTIKKRFFQEDIITRRIIPDITKLGFEVVVFAHVRLKGNREIDEPSLKEAMREENMIISYCHGTDVVTVSAFSSFSKTKTRVASFLRDAQQQVVFNGEPVIFLFSAKDLIYQLDHRYDVPVATILQIDTESIFDPDSTSCS